MEGNNMDFKTHLETSWNLTLKYLAPLILMTLALLAAGFLTLGILAPVVSAGYIQSIIMMMRDSREPRAQDIFSQMKLFLPLLGFSIVVLIVMMIGFSMLVLPGLVVVLAVTFGCLYMIPLMTDQKMRLMDALKTSWQMATQPNIADHIVVVILFNGLIAIGGSVFIGMLFTVPFATVFLVSVYLERIGADQKDVTASG
jgi:hypothetical protein